MTRLVDEDGWPRPRWSMVDVADPRLGRVCRWECPVCLTVQRIVGGQWVCRECGYDEYEGEMGAKTLIGIRPVHDNIIIDPMHDSDHWDANKLIVRPDASKLQLKRGRVVAVGPGKTDNDGFHPPPVAIGDVILFAMNWQGHAVYVGDHEYRALSLESVMCIVDDYDEAHPERIEQ